MFIKQLHIEEPKLEFANGQVAHDPRDGLMLYGAYDDNRANNPNDIHDLSVGVIGEEGVLEKYINFVSTIKSPIISKKKNKKGVEESNELQRPSFLGCETIFNITWDSNPTQFLKIDEKKIEKILDEETNKRVKSSKVVDCYLDLIQDFQNNSDKRIDIWFVVVSRRIYKECRTLKGGGKDFSKKEVAKAMSKQTSMFLDEEMHGKEIKKYMGESPDFHNLMKARANQESIREPLQIIIDSKLEFKDAERNKEYSDDMKASLAWNLCTTLYYKIGKKPWKLSAIRSGVCYVGLVFKKFQNIKEEKYACSAAQLFMDDGDGTIFKGNNGMWLSENKKEFHLDRKEACKLLDLALSEYKKNNKEYPKEIFIHGRADFANNEWNGFLDAIEAHGNATKLFGILIKERPSIPLKVFRDTEDGKNNYGVLRGTAMILNEKEAYLFTKGFIPRLGTSNCLELPNPLYVKVTRGEKDIEIVLKDIMSLTKLNYNSCIYGDGKPVTLRFSDDIGDILTATDNIKGTKQQFKYYI